MEFALAFIGFMLTLTLISWAVVLISAGFLRLYQLLESHFKRSYHD